MVIRGGGHRRVRAEKIKAQCINNEYNGSLVRRGQDTGSIVADTRF